ncbi:DUF3558 domain-containing protein [Rhodococcus sp. NPDC058521]|uniref:DUF3558 domain-containing protein n=1 Tax=Rhodococcus sp. NPDC058521 TaxID=3346536 RepID=UPI00364B0069
MNRASATCALALSIAVLSGCGTTDSDSESATSSAESTTRVPRLTDDSERPPVAFDPCLDIPDEILSGAGYDPSSKKVSDYPMGDYTFLGCDFKTPVRQYGLSFLSSNISFAEEEQKTAAYAQPITVNGRRALLEVQETNRETCAISLETSYGILIVIRNLHHNEIGIAPQEQWCAGLEDTVRQIEPLLPKD